ncbi:MAG: HK97 family phage prohead protease, partial [Planctomycetaceae bacterium]
SGTLRLWSDSRGLGFEVDLPESEPARTLAEAVRRGDLSGMSFAFTGARDKWEQDAEGLLRTVTSATLTEVSAVAWPAYEASRVSVAGDLSATPSAKSETVRQMCERQAVAARVVPANLDLARRRMQLARMRHG